MGLTGLKLSQITLRFSYLRPPLFSCIESCGLGVFFPSFKETTCVAQSENLIEFGLTDRGSRKFPQLLKALF